MNTIMKPMLAVTCEDVNALNFPVLATPKLDGIRCVIKDGKALSRKFKNIPNQYIFDCLRTLPEGLDGEIMLKGKGNTFQQISSAVMSEDGTPAFEYNVFDYVSGSLFKPYSDRMKELKALNLPHYVKKILPLNIKNVEELNVLEETFLADGYEGVMVRFPDGPYKCGRSTAREGYLLKIKRFTDAEATVIGVEERMHNENEATTDELGHTKRSSHQAGKVPAGLLGSFIVRDITSGLEFSIGTGFDDEFRKKVWENPKSYIGQLVKYKYQAVGVKDLPRFPVFIGMRHKDDL